MDELKKQYHSIYADIGWPENQACSPDGSCDLFDAQISKLATKMVADLDARRSRIYSECQSKRQDLARLASDLGIGDPQLPKVSPPYQTTAMALDTQINKFQSILTERERRLCQLYDECADISEKIGETPPKLPANHHKETIDQYRDQLNKLRQKRDERMERYTDIVGRLLPLCEELGTEGNVVLTSNPFDFLLDSHFASLEADIKELSAIREDRLLQKENLVSEIKDLAAFLETSVSFIPSLELAYIQDLENQKQTMTERMTQKIRDSMDPLLAEYSDHCEYFGLDKKFSSDLDANRENFDNLSKEVERLAKARQDRKKIDTALEELRALKRDEKELEAATRNPDRFKQRGAVLIEENKRRSRVLTRKPRIISMLDKLLASWRSIHDSPCIVQGEDLAQILVKERQSGTRQQRQRLAQQTASSAVLPEKIRPKAVQSARAAPSARPIQPPVTRPAMRISRTTKPPHQTSRDTKLAPALLATQAAKFAVKSSAAKLSVAQRNSTPKSAHKAKPTTRLAATPDTRAISESTPRQQGFDVAKENVPPCIAIEETIETPLTASYRPSNITPSIIGKRPAQQNEVPNPTDNTVALIDANYSVDDSMVMVTAQHEKSFHNKWREEKIKKLRLDNQ